MGSKIYPEVHENPRAFFSSSSPILLEPLAHGSSDWSLPREDCIRFYSERFDIYIACFRKLAQADAEKREKLESEKRHANRGRILAFQSLLLLFSHPPLLPNKAPTFGAHFRSKSQKEGIPGVVKCVATSGTSKIQLVLFECCFAWMLWKLGRIDGDPVLRETRIWATWEYVSSVGGGQQGMVGLCAHCGCGKTCCAPSPDRHLVPHVMEWYLEICRGGQETLGTSGGVLLPKTKLDQSRPNPGIVGQLKNEVRKPREPLIVMAAQLIRDRVEMECLEGAWETLEGNTRCRFRGTIRFTATSLVHPDEPARTLQRTVEWILPTPTPYRLVEPVQVIEVTSSEEDPEEDLEELPPEPAVDALDFLEGDEDPLLEVDSPEEVMSASEADSTEDSGPREMAISGGSSS
ncbi:hypothetical protein HKD37_20G056058 [Glycine soja]